MAELLLVNPRKRARKARKARRARSRRRNPISNLGAFARSRPAQRSISGRRRRRVARRRNPIGLRGRLAVARGSRRARRRNPIGMGGGSLVKSFVSMVKDAAVGGAGAIAADLAMGQINRFLPASMQRVPGKVGVGDAVKAAITVVLAKVLAKPTRGLSMKMGQGALTVQMHQVLAGFVPPSLQLGYLVPGRVIDATARVGPMQARGNTMNGLRAYAPAGTPSPLLNAYTRPGVTPLLSGARRREGAVR